MKLVEKLAVIAMAVVLAPAVGATTFTADLDVDLTGAKAERLWEIPGAITLAVREAGQDKSLFAYDQGQGNYLAFRLADGTCPVIEATMACPAGRVGIPLGALANPGGRHAVTLDFNGVYWSILVDGKHLDRDLPWKDLPAIDGTKAKTLSPRVKSAALKSPARKDAIMEMAKSRPIDGAIQYWTPQGHNAWLGDVSMCTYEGRLHVFYLHDRRHHKSKNGKGGHFFAHLSSCDLTHWTEHPAAVPIAAPLESQGTGTPFVWSNRLCLAYGLHTMRFMDADKTTEPVQRRYFEANGRDGAFRIADTPGFPAGGTYAESFDGGETFVRSGILMTRAQNPTVYNRADGRMGLVMSYGGVKGIFASDRLGDWTLVDDSVPFCGDCPCYFEWHGHAYLLQGFCHMAYNRDAKPGRFVDWTISGDDIYDGLSVPMVASWKGDRRIIAGWLRHLYGWGGWLCFRELVQEKDGRLGTKWVPEIQPRGEVSEHRVKSGKGLSLRFRRVGGTDEEMEFSVDAARRRAQFSDCKAGRPAPERKTIAEILGAVPPAERTRRALGKNAPDHGENFAIGHVLGLDADYVVRLARYYDAKSDATVFDAEIAGRRTMVCRRPGRYDVAPVAVPYVPSRPLFHFTAPTGAINDPNGMTFFKGEWHLFYQYKPDMKGKFPDKHWGHAVSKDLVRWQHLPPALAPDEHGMCYSGNGAIDWNNTAGFGAGAQVMLYPAVDDKAHPRVQHLAYSLDGRTYVKYAGNPVIPSLPEVVHKNQKDPELFWYEPIKKWVSLLVITDGGFHKLAILHSPDLKKWTRVGEIAGDPVDEGIYLYDCPDFFELPVEGTSEKRWVLICGNRQYAVGTFDGYRFTPEAERLEAWTVCGDNPLEWYAGQTFEDAPGGRRVQICWWRTIRPKGAPFQSAMSLPMELSLVKTAKGLRLARRPVKELETLRSGPATDFAGFRGELLEAEFACTLAEDAVVTLDFRGVRLQYSRPRGTLSLIDKGVEKSTRWEAPGGRLALRVFLDRQGMEVFSSDGLQTLPIGSAVPNPMNRRISWRATGVKKPVRDVTERAWRLKGAVDSADAPDGALKDRTLVSWAMPARLDQRAGSALTINQGERFDGLVYAEVAKDTWMLGSDYSRRTCKQQAAWPKEQITNAYVQVAATYREKDRTVTLYRNGAAFASYAVPEGVQTSFDGDAIEAIIGIRHAGRTDTFIGRVKDARIYDKALTAEQIAALKPGVMGEVRPFAWWNFATADVYELTGRYAPGELVGGAAVEDGALILRERGDTFIAQPRAKAYR
jgi:sucrose-6-phosphate hydrolase SacC (GH32 family)